MNSSGGGDRLTELFAFLLVSVCTVKQEGQGLILDSSARKHRSGLPHCLGFAPFLPHPMKHTGLSTSFLYIIFSYDVSNTTRTEFQHTE